MKRAVAMAILLWVGLWPLAHRALVAHYDVNPWKLSGWAMYTVASPPVLVAFFEKGAGGLVPIDETTLPAPLRAELTRFRVERHALGRLRRPDGVAASVLRSRPELPWLVVAVQQMALDPGSALMTSHKNTYLYERSAEGVELQRSEPAPR